MPKKQFEQFRTFTEKHHADQMYGDAPYVTHLDRVTAIINKHAGNHDLLHTLQFCAMGHDLIEDTQATFSAVESHSNSTAACAILLISDPDAPNRKERKILAFARFNECEDTIVKSVAATTKMADRLDNMTSCLNDVMSGVSTRKAKMYLKEQAEFMETFEKHCLFESLTNELKSVQRQIDNHLSKQAA